MGAMDLLLKGYYKLPFRPFRNTLAKLYRWKIRNEKGEVIAKTHGFKIHLDLNDITNNHIYHGIYKTTIVDMIKRELREGDIALDIGSHTGYFALIFASIVGNNGKVYAFEPTKQAFNVIKKNVALNNFKNVIIENIGLSDKNEETNIDMQFKYDKECIDEGKTKNEKHLLITLDNYVKKNKIPKIKLIKIDTNCFDLRILMGATETIKKFRPIVIVKTSYEEEHHGKERMKYYKK
ncbi:MAG: FkbM family methyltransferase, partial [Candidatus Pacearchaeota archaeon]